MSIEDLHRTLRSATGELHASLDKSGGFADLAGYRRYLSATYVFRVAIEASFDAASPWHPLPLAPDLAADLQSLDHRPSKGIPALSLPTPSQALGAAYVVEGSAMGARILLQQALSLGLSADFGARHLHRQTAGSRWRDFLTVQSEGSWSEDEVVTGAKRAYQLAIDAFAAESQTA